MQIVSKRSLNTPRARLFQHSQCTCWNKACGERCTVSWVTRALCDEQYQGSCDLGRSHNHCSSAMTLDKHWLFRRVELNSYSLSCKYPAMDIKILVKHWYTLREKNPPGTNDSVACTIFKNHMSLPTIFKRRNLHSSIKYKNVEGLLKTR